MPVALWAPAASAAPLHEHRAACLRRWRRPGACRRAALVAAAAAGGGSRTGTCHHASSTRPCHYETLGLPRSASRAEVKRAFRRLARLWHPDVNPSPAASERFQAIARAFEVLSDDQQRQQYDQARWGLAAGGSYARAGGRARAPQGPGFVDPPPPDLHAELQLDFREAALGAERWVEVQAMDACGACAGTGAAPGTPATPCPMCKGRREILRRQRVGAIEARNHEAGQVQLTVCCPACAGRGYSITHPCACCVGAGLARQARRVAVRVPPGAEDGGRLRLAGEGDVARVGGPRGGLVLELQVAQEEGMWRRGLDLHSQLAVPLWDALLGGTATVATLRGAASLTIPPGTQHGAVLSLAHAGVEQDAGGSGDWGSTASAGAGGWSRGGGSSSRGAAGQQSLRGSHHFEVCVQLPRELSSAEEALLRRLRELQRQRQRGGAG
ncbi:hypothetical protein ABPG75_013855 [Micractinium tetrahymenae]